MNEDPHATCGDDPCAVCEELIMNTSDPWHPKLLPPGSRGWCVFCRKAGELHHTTRLGDGVCPQCAKTTEATMPNTPDNSPERIARDLIDIVKRMEAPRAALLEDRIVATLIYLTEVSTPNMITLTHVERFLTGDRDKDLALYLAADRAKEIRENLS